MRMALASKGIDLALWIVGSFASTAVAPDATARIKSSYSVLGQSMTADLR